MHTPIHNCWSGLITLLMILSLLPLGHCAATEYDVYLLAGQSNMDGRGKAADLSEAQRQPFEEAIIFYRNPPAASDGWKPLAPGYSIAPGYKGGLPSPTFGPEIGFARSMLQAALHTKSHLSIKSADSGGLSIKSADGV